MIPKAKGDSGADHNIQENMQLSRSYNVPGTL